MALVVLLVGSLLIFQFGKFVVGAIGSAFDAETQPTPQVSTQTAPEVDPSPTISPTFKVEPCSLEDIAISVEVEDGPEFSQESELIINATITNTGSVKCRRDIGSESNEIYVRNSENKEVWSSDICPTAPPTKTLVDMKPGSIYRVTLLWNGSGKPASCDQIAQHVPAGDYEVFARNAQAISEPVTITFN